MIKKLIEMFKTSLNRPVQTLDNLRALLRGTWYIFMYRILNPGVRIQFPFFAFTEVTINGPGRVNIGSNCAVFKNVFKGLSIVTLSNDSIVNIGDRCALGGLTIRCKSKVEIGDKTMTAISLVQDILFINEIEQESPELRDNKATPVKIGNNVWLGAYSIVLGGSVIGDDSVISAGSCTYRAVYKEYQLISGNLALKSFPIDKLMSLRG